MTVFCLFLFVAAVYNAELVLTGVLRQKLDFKMYPFIIAVARVDQWYEVYISLIPGPFQHAIWEWT